MGATATTTALPLFAPREVFREIFFFFPPDRRRAKMSTSSPEAVKKLLENMQTDLRSLSMECKKKFPPVKEVRRYPPLVSPSPCRLSYLCMCFYIRGFAYCPCLFVCLLEPVSPPRSTGPPLVLYRPTLTQPSHGSIYIMSPTACFDLFTSCNHCTHRLVCR